MSEDSQVVRGWQQIRHYPDHRGHPVVLEQYVEPEWTPDPSHLVPIQVYSIVPLDPDHEGLREYLLQTFYNDEVLPMFEFYSYCPPDAFDCMEHNRRETAYRKQQRRSGVSDPPPLIPQFFVDADRTPFGRCILLCSYSYRLGCVGDPDEYAAAGEGPDLILFNRSFSNTRNHGADDELHPEIFEMSTERLKNQTDMGQTVILEFFIETSNGADTPRYAMDEDEGVAPDSNPTSEDDIRRQLEDELSVAGGAPLDLTFNVSRHADHVTATNTPPGVEADLQYLVHVPFLSHLKDTTGPALLNDTARLFTTALLSHLPAPKTLNLIFSIPESDAWSAIRPAYHHVLGQQDRQRTEFAIGALHTFSANCDEPPARHRIPPKDPSDSIAGARRAISEPCRIFAVVLNRADFVTEAGIYFYLADHVGLEGLPSEYHPHPADTEIRRCTGMREVARRLAMLVIEEE